MESSDNAGQQFTKGEVSISEAQSPIKLASKKRIWLVLSVLVVAIVALLILKAAGLKKSSDQSNAGIITASDHSPGSEVTLYIEKRTSVLVAVDEQSLNDLIDALGSKGEEIQALVDSGKVFDVPNNTRVRVEEAKFPKLKVRFIEGKRVMTEAWVPERWVR